MDPYPWKVIVISEGRRRIWWSDKTRKGAREEAKVLRSASLRSNGLESAGLPAETKVTVEKIEWGFQ